MRQDSRCAGEDCRDRTALFTELRTAIAAEASASGRLRWLWLRLICWRHWPCRNAAKLLPAGFRGIRRRSEIEIVEGRHPVIEQQEMAGGSERFVPTTFI